MSLPIGVVLLITFTAYAAAKFLLVPPARIILTLIPEHPSVIRRLLTAFVAGPAIAAALLGVVLGFFTKQPGVSVFTVSLVSGFYLYSAAAAIDTLWKFVDKKLEG